MYDSSVCEKIRGLVLVKVKVKGKSVEPYFTCYKIRRAENKWKFVLLH